MAVWGQKWAKGLEDDRVFNDAVNLWGRALSNLPQEKIPVAVQRCSLLHKFPPSISEFLEAVWEIPSLSIFKANGGGNGEFCKILNDRINRKKSRTITYVELDYLIKGQYEALREEFLLGLFNE